MCVDDPGGHEVGPASTAFAAVGPVSRDPFPSSTRMRIVRGKGTHVKEWLMRKESIDALLEERRRNNITK